RLQKAYPDLFSDLEPARLYGGPIPTNFVARSYADGVLLVGDAAGQVKPFSGGGIYTSLVSAGLCAETASEALAAGDLSAGFLSRYERRWRKTIGRELKRSLGIRRFGLALSDREVDRVVGVLSSRRLQEIASRHADIDYPSRVLLRIAAALPALGPLALISLRRPVATLRLLQSALFS
ncbi:MAG TPA: hypothetical protein VFB90_06130, partial [Dehalococcoidia bacterium]|nr:hypothetical protein [Dehalococcoidia bacterium]